MSIETKGSGEGERRNYQLNSAGKPERNDDHLCSPSPSTFASHLKLTLKAWPLIALATIGLCFLTQQVAKLFGIELPDQENIELVRRFAGWNLTFVSLCVQVIAVMPALEETYFRYFVYRRAQVPLSKRSALQALMPTAAFLLLALGVWFSPATHARLLSHTTAQTYFAGLAFGLVAEYAVRVFLGRLFAKTSVWAIAGASAVLFSAAHYISQPWPDSAFLALFFFGFAQCWLYRKTDRIWCPMLNHALFNLTNLILLFVIPQV